MTAGICQLVFLVTFFGACLTFSNKCQRQPYGFTVPKNPGDGGYRIKISGNPKKYVPGEVYTVSLQGQRRKYSVQKFTGFMLIVEAAPNERVSGLHSVGTFQLYGGLLAMHSKDCPNAVIQTSNIVKTGIQILWTAPPAGSGCLRFKGVVIEQKDHWYMDDDKLTKELCEEVQESDDLQPEVIHDCCACNEAKYEVTFEGLWSRQTHPKDFPANEWLTHFSDIIGASHSNDYRVWEYGGLASDGLRQVAEWGSTRVLESELKRQSDQIRTIIKARGLWYPNVTGKTFAVFRVDNRHHLMSLVSMLGPSPDWIVGVSALELCLNNCSWVGQKTLNLYPWDAGTDSGATYMSAPAVTIPRMKISRITNSYPNDPKNPFYDPKGLPMKPLAKLTVTRQRVYEKSCSSTGIIHDDEIHIDEDMEESERPECAVSQWEPFGPCSAKCGKGIRTRYRHYLNPMKAEMFRCKRQLEGKEFCSGRDPICEGGNEHNFDGPAQYGNIHDIEARSNVCSTTEWSSWTICTAACGEGHQIRSRRYLHRMAHKTCGKEVRERKPCMGEIAECDNDKEIIDPACSVTEWSTWTPCTASCGEGVRTRTRHFLVPTSNQANCKVNSMDKIKCLGDRKVCKLSKSEAKEVCSKESHTGPCRGYFLKWYYNQLRDSCVQFVYGGCRSNGNNFNTVNECEETCKFSEDELTYAKRPSSNAHRSYFVNPSWSSSPKSSKSRYFPANLIPASQVGTKIDCKMTPWNPFSECSVSCGSGWKESKRRMRVKPQFGGKSCPRKLVRRRKCKEPRCNRSKNSKLETMNSIFERSDMSKISSPRYTAASNQRTSSYSKQRTLMKEIEENYTKRDCVMGNWAPWSPCTHTCGPNALQQRIRSILEKPRLDGSRCGPQLERRFCTLPPCSRRRGYS